MSPSFWNGGIELSVPWKDFPLLCKMQKRNIWFELSFHWSLMQVKWGESKWRIRTGVVSRQKQLDQTVDAGAAKLLLCLGCVVCLAKQPIGGRWVPPARCPRFDGGSRTPRSMARKHPLAFGWWPSFQILLHLFGCKEENNKNSHIVAKMP